MGLHVIGSNMATCTQRVLMVLAEKGVTDFTMYQPDFATGEHKRPPHTDKQPFGVIPVLEDGDFTLNESRAICRYLAAKFKDQGTKLMPDPTDAEASALFEQWASMETSNFDVYATPLVGQKLFGPMRGLTPIPEVVDFMTTALTGKLDIYEKILAKQKYMGGDEFSLVDIFYMPYTAKLFQTGDGHLITDRPSVNAWWELVSNRETWKTLMTPKA